MKRRLCVLIPGFFDGGAQRQCIFLLNELGMREDVEVTLLYFHEGINDHLLNHIGINIIKINVSSNYDPRNIFKIKKIIRRIKPEILMTWMHSCDVYGYFLKAAVPGMRWVMTERDSFYPFDVRYLLRRYLGRYADAIVANSMKGAQYWRDSGALGQISVINNIVYPVPQLASVDNPSRIVSIGRLEPQKNTHTVVEAFGLLAAKRSDIAFAVIGDGSERVSLESLASKTTGHSRIEFLGFRKDIPAQLHASMLVVSMSHHEGLPNVLLEAVAAGTIIVASDIPEHRELLGPDYPFYVINRSNSSCVADVIEAAMALSGTTELLTYARKRLDSMTPASVTNTYLAAFSRIIEE